MVVLALRLSRIVLALLALSGAAVAEGRFRLEFQTEGTPDRPVTGEMIPVILRGEYDRPIANEKLTIAGSDSFDWIQTRADDWTEERIDGERRMVLRRHLALWPRRSGLLSFGPAQHELTIITRTGARAPAVVTAEPLAIAVGPHPDPMANGWKFAALDVEILEELSTDPARLPDGGTVTRRITLRALGALPEHLPPRPLVSEPWLITFAAPVRRSLSRTAEGPLAEVVWEWQFRPEHGEPGVLEPVRIPWYNARSHRMDVAVIPAITIGYESYYTGQVPRGRLSAGLRLSLFAALLAGGVAGLIAGGLRHAPGGTVPVLTAAVARGLRRWDPRRHLALRRARRAGDLLAQRRLAEELDRPLPERRALEARIYGRAPD